LKQKPKNNLKSVIFIKSKIKNPKIKIAKSFLSLSRDILDFGNWVITSHCVFVDQIDVITTLKLFF